MRCIKTITLLCLSGALISACTSLPQGAVPISTQTEAAFRQAVALAKAGQTTKAISAFTRIARAEPKLTGAHVNLGMLFLTQSEYQKSVDELNTAIELNPTHAIAYAHLGLALRKQGKFDMAKAAYEHAIQLDSRYALAHLNLGILLDLYLGDVNEALVQYRRYQALDGDKDKTVEKWIVDLERQQKSSPSPGGHPG